MIRCTRLRQFGDGNAAVLMRAVSNYGSTSTVPPLRVETVPAAWPKTELSSYIRDGVVLLDVTLA